MFHMRAWSLLLLLAVIAVCTQAYGDRNGDKRAMRNSLVRFGKRNPAPQVAYGSEADSYLAPAPFAPLSQNPVLGYYQRYYNQY